MVYPHYCGRSFGAPARRRSVVVRTVKSEFGVVAVFQSTGIDPAKIHWDIMSNVWFYVLGRAAALGRFRDLVDALIDRFQATALRDFIDQLPEIDLAQDVPAAVPESNPFGGRLLPQRRAFLDRNPVRAALTDLSSADGPRVLVVDGPSGSGRSHVWYLVSHGCDRLGLPRNVAVRIQPSSSSVDAKAWEPLDLMNDIAERLEWPKPGNVNSNWPHCDGRSWPHLCLFGNGGGERGWLAQKVAVGR
jgi:hypothetical protein